MSNGAIRTAFWSLLTACGLLMAAAVSDPYEVQLALSTPPTPSIDQRPSAIMLAEAVPQPNSSSPNTVRFPASDPLVAAEPGISSFPVSAPPAISTLASDNGPFQTADRPREAGRPESPLRIAATNLNGLKLDRNDIGFEITEDADEKYFSNDAKRSSSPFYPSLPQPHPVKPDYYRAPPSDVALDTMEKPTGDRRVPEPTIDVFEEDLQIVTIDDVLDKGRIQEIARAEAEEYFRTIQPQDETSNDNESLAKELIRELVAARLNVSSQNTPESGNKEPAVDRTAVPSVVVATVPREKLPTTPAAQPLLVEPVPASRLLDSDHADHQDKRSSPSAEQLSDNRFRFHIAKHSVSDVLDLLARVSETNILASDMIGGEVVANLTDVTAEQALTAIARSHDFVVEHDSPFVYVMTRLEAEERQRSNVDTVTRVFRPSYSTAAAMLPIVEQLLTPGVGTALVSSSRRHEGSKTPSSPALYDAMVVVDLPDVIERVEQIVGELDQAPGQVVIEAVLLNISLRPDQPRGICAQLFSDRLGIPPLPAPTTLLGQVGETGDVSSGPMELSLGSASTDIDSCVAALSATNRTKILASPRLSIVDGHDGEILIGGRIAVPTSASGDEQKWSGVQFLESWTKLVLSPTISRDGRVRLSIHPERSSASISSITKLPMQRTTELTTNVMVHDGETLIIGGLIEERVSRHETRVPMLGSLPGVGHKFRKHHNHVHRTEFVVLLNARIVHDFDSL